jgi:putative flippase GtrA
MSDFRPRSNSEILDAAFEIYRRHFTVFIAINVLAAVPWAVSSYFGQTAILLQQTDGLFTSALIRFAGVLISPFTEGAIACAASAAYLGNQVDFEQSMRAAFSHPGRLFIAMITKWILIGFGLVLFIAPGLVVFKRYFALPMTVLFEDNKVGDAMSRSRELANGNGTRIFALLGGVFLFVLIATGILLQLVQAFAHSTAATAIATLVLTTAISPFSSIIATLLYYDIRIRREGYDIELMTQALGVPQLHSAS